MKDEVTRKYIGDVINDKDKLIKMSDDKIARLEVNIKMLEGQMESVVSEKFNATKKLSEVEDEYKRLKKQNTEQEVTIDNLKREMEAFNEQKEQILMKFNLLKSQEKVHDIVVGSIKREFDQTFVDFMSSTNRSMIVARKSVGTEEVNTVQSNEVDPLSMENTTRTQMNGKIIQNFLKAIKAKCLFLPQTRTIVVPWSHPRKSEHR